MTTNPILVVLAVMSRDDFQHYAVMCFPVDWLNLLHYENHIGILPKHSQETTTNMARKLKRTNSPDYPYLLQMSGFRFGPERSPTGST